MVTRINVKRDVQLDPDGGYDHRNRMQSYIDTLAPTEEELEQVVDPSRDPALDVPMREVIETPPQDFPEPPQAA